VKKQPQQFSQESIKIIMKIYNRLFSFGMTAQILILKLLEKVRGDFQK
jgi:hypothetical protein